MIASLAHSTQKNKIRKACHEEYPKIREQIRQPASERGLLSFICDQLIDIEFLDDEVDEANDTDYREVDQVEMPHNCRDISELGLVQWQICFRVESCYYIQTGAPACCVDSRD